MSRFDDLQILTRVVEDASVSQAVANLNIAESAPSLHIADLEA
ncbi:helix-turn-helix domain-containing protein [Kaarinaea lacus]